MTSRKIIRFLSISLIALSTFSGELGHAQTASNSLPQSKEYGIYDTDLLPASFHAGRRTALLNKLPEGAAALFLAAPMRNRANDVSYKYHQDPNFYYLTGLTEANSALLLSKDGIELPNGKRTHEVLFVQQRDPAKEIWTGYRLGPEGSKSILGFENVLLIDSLNSFLKTILPNTQQLYYKPMYDAVTADPTIDTTFNLWNAAKEQLITKYPLLQVESPLAFLAQLRSIKQPEELELMKKSIRISMDAHKEIMRRVRPGWHEYEMQALGEYVFTKNGAEYTGYPCIVGSGENSTILHYESNRRKTAPGDFIEMDIGAEYHGYSADITRSFPITGKFTPEQRAIYNIVLEAQDSGIKASQADSIFKAPHLACVSVITKRLLELGIIKKPEDYKKYFMHGTSHYLGLDVHDAGLYGPLQPGNVITVEPGIYIKAGSDCDPKWWNIGCRIEDDILITANGPVILSNELPRTPIEIEKLMTKD